ncbi:MmgE/PrpD family protein [Streptomyces sp. NPDC059766]|uniref:MmgE/PrpD family protein n=1 Tax=Streptomyces sp. NPDC059766 TaxID=3346940 RepID=UPI003649ED6E
MTGTTAGPQTTRTVGDLLTAQVLRIRDLPASSLPWHGVSTALLDTLAVGCAGAGHPISAGLRREVGAPAGPARIWGTAGSTDALQAALLNGVAAHVLELDDIYAPGTVHPGSVVIPAALAVADESGAHGQALARAISAGYEVCGRLAADLGPSHYRNWHTTGTAGAVGAAAAAALLLGAGETTIRNALALAATMSGGLQQLFRQDASGKPLHAGHAAMAGVLAAKTARAGVGGSDDVFEGPSGMAVAMGGSGRWAYVQGEDVPFCVDEVTVKPYPCCGHSFAPIDGALRLRGRVGLDAIASITVDTYRAGLEVAGIPVPATDADTRFSIPFLVALALTDGTVTREALTPDRLTDPRFAALVAVTEVRIDDAFEELFPRRRGARITIVTHDGESHTATVPDRSGSPANPLSADQLHAKYDGLLAGVPAAARDELRARILDLASLTTVARLPIPTGAQP